MAVLMKILPAKRFDSDKDVNRKMMIFTLEIRYEYHCCLLGFYSK